MERPFELSTEFEPAGDQPQAIDALVRGLQDDRHFQTLLGVTGSGKTFTLANVIERVQRPVLVISHNKTLAAQLYSEFKHFFPKNAVEYFISYYDYYLPEAYIPQTDTYIAKDAHINEEIEKLRLAATSSLLDRKDVIVIASVSCIYGLGSPEDFMNMSVPLEVGQELVRDEMLARLIDLQYQRNDLAPERGEFRVSGDTVDVYPAYRDDVVRIELWGDEVERLTRRDPLTMEELEGLERTTIFPASHFVTPAERVKIAERDIKEEMKEQVRKFESEGRLVEAQRIYQRTMYDLEMLREVGFCSGIENYSRHLSRRKPGERPFCLVDFFPEDFITIIDESHVTIPQLRAMYKADRTRKETLVEHGFRLPSALDNRPLTFEEIEKILKQTIFMSATPSDYEVQHSVPVQQVIRPTGLLDPIVTIRPLDGQIDDLMAEVRECASRGERVLVTTLTKRTSEDLSEYLAELGVRVKYLHSDIDAIERVDILRDLRTGDFDCLVGVNLLREGLDLPEVALVAILDADKEGFLRSQTALIQTAGRAARHIDGRVILYADRITDSIQAMLTVTTQRRDVQAAFNERHNITPTSATRAIQESLRLYSNLPGSKALAIAENTDDLDVAEVLRQLEGDMFEAAEQLEFERAAMIRDQIAKLKRENGIETESVSKPQGRSRGRKNVRY